MPVKTPLVIVMLLSVLPLVAQNPAPPLSPAKDAPVVAEAAAIPRFQIIHAENDEANGSGLKKFLILLDNQTGETWEYVPGGFTTMANGTKQYVPHYWDKISR
jgi:hypothetical protein